MNYTQHTNEQLKNNRNTAIATVHTLKQNMDYCELTTEERVNMNEAISAMYRQQFDIEREIQDRCREILRQDVYTIIRQAANIMQNGQVTVHNGYDMERFDQFEITLRLHDLGVKDALAIFQELTHHWGQNVTFDNQFGVTEFYINISVDWVEALGLN